MPRANAKSSSNHALKQANSDRYLLNLTIYSYIIRSSQQSAQSSVFVDPVMFPVIVPIFAYDRIYVTPEIGGGRGFDANAIYLMRPWPLVHIRIFL